MGRIPHLLLQNSPTCHDHPHSLGQPQPVDQWHEEQALTLIFRSILPSLSLLSLSPPVPLSPDSPLSVVPAVVGHLSPVHSIILSIYPIPIHCLCSLPPVPLSTPSPIPIDYQ